MSRSKILVCALLAALVTATPVEAAKDQVGQEGAVTLDPAKSYIFYRAGRKAPVRFLREVDSKERSEHERERSAAYAKAQAKYVKKLAEWKRSEAEWQESTTSQRTRMIRLDKPAPLTEETFAYPSPEADNWLTVKAGPRFSDDPDGSSYLISVEPGTYVLYGQITDTQNGPIGTCLCMGTVKFAAPAGQIVDIGRIDYPRIEAAKADLEGKIRSRPSHSLTPPDPAMPRPARLSGLRVVAADLRAADKMPNFFGIEIDRLPAVPGVLAYQRDRVVDLKGAAFSR